MEQIDILKHLLDLCMQIGAMAVSEPLARSTADLTNSQLLALRFILLHPDCTLTLLAKGLDITPPATTKVMDRLEKKGLVERVQGADRRQIIANLTPEGRREVINSLSHQMAAFHELLLVMSQQDRDALETGLEALSAAAVQQWPGWKQLCMRCGTGCAQEDCPLYRHRGA